MNNIYNCLNCPVSTSYRLTQARLMSTKNNESNSDSLKPTNSLVGKKKLYQRLYIGLKKGFLTPTLPEHILAIHNNVFIRIFRVVSGISVLLIITHALDSLGDGLLYLICLYFCFILNIIFGIYIIFINYYRIKHIYKILRSDALDIRNSPFDKMSTIAARFIMCTKGVCEVVAPFGVFYGIMSGYDEFRTIKGHVPIFKPFLANLIIYDTELSSLSKERLKFISYLTQNNLEQKSCEEEWKIIEKLLENEVINEEDANKWKEHILRKQSSLELSSMEIKKKMIENLDKSNEIILKRK